MATFTFVGDPNHTSVSWENPAVWSGDAFPNDPTANVVIPTIFFVNTSKVDAFTIRTNADVSIGQLSITGKDTLVVNNLTIAGGLTVGNAHVSVSGDTSAGGAVSIQSGGEFDISGAAPTFSGASFDNAGLIYVYRASIVSTGAFTNEAGAKIENYSDNAPLNISAASFNNLGDLFSLDGDMTVTVNPGGFANFSNGTLTGGQYQAGDAAGGGLLRFNVGGVVTTDAALMIIGMGGDIQFFNPSTSSYQPIEATLQTIAPRAALEFEQASSRTWTNALTVDGTFSVPGTLTVPQLTIASGGTGGVGTLNGPLTVNSSGTFNAGVVNGAVIDNGAITGGHFTGTVTGSGTVSGGAEFGVAASVDVTLTAQLILDDPGAFTGAITPVVGATVLLPAVQLNDVTSYSYAPTDGDHGVLTLHMSTGPAITLDFTGHFDTGSFQLSNGQKLSSDPPNVLITIENNGPPPLDDFLNAGVSDILLENASGQIDVGQMGGGSMALTEIFASLGSQWKFEGNGDFLGNGADQFLIENGSGSVGLGSVVGGALHLSTIATLDPSLKFVDTGDFLGNGHAEFITESSSGLVDLGQVSGGKATQTQIDTLGSQWKFVGAGDYLGTGHDQAAIENTLGNVGVGAVTGSSVNFTAVGVLSSTQHIVQSGDFLGDGKSDFLIDNTATGALDVGEVVNGSLSLTQIDTLGSQWSFVGAGDYLGDGKDQFLIENTAGNLGIGEVSGGTIHFTTIATGFSEWMFH